MDDVLRDSAERLSESQREFVESLAHELKTPLAAIIGLADTLLRKQEIDPSTRTRFLEKISDQAVRLSSLLDDLLTLSALESSADALRLEALDLREPVAAALQDLVPVAEEKGLALKIDLPVEPVSIQGDAKALRRLVGNLVDNAIKYTEYGGSVWLRVSTADGSTAIEVEDTGVGIDAAHQAAVFERFFVGEKGRSQERKGTGLGLALVKQIARVHGGDVTLSSTPGRGSTFRVRLPLTASSKT